MKILLVNKFYYGRGGAEIYVLNLEEFLKAKEHDVAVFSMQHPQGLESPYSKYFPENVEYGKVDAKQFRLLLTRPFGTKEVKRKFHALLNDFQPDVVHFNNIHTHLSPVIQQIAHERGVKTVWTIHDLKLLCPDTLCLRSDGEICELCFHDKRSVLKYKCNKNSFKASLIAYLEAKKWTKEKLGKYTDVFICPSKFMASKLIRGGYDDKKISVLCNFIDVEKTKRENYAKEDYYCYVGRLSREKGIKTLIEAAKQLPFHLKIVGSGPLSEELQQSANKNKNIEFVGHQRWEGIKDIVGKARFSVTPSECYENNPLSVIESKCLGTPVLGANIGGIPELIEEKSGMFFESRNVNDLKEKTEQMFSAKFDYENLAKESQNRYSAEYYYQKILNIYQK